MSYKLICIDMDGTLLNNKNMKLVKEIKKGYKKSYRERRKGSCNNR